MLEMGRKYTLPTETGKEGTHSIKGNLSRYLYHINHTQKTMYYVLYMNYMQGLILSEFYSLLLHQAFKRHSREAKSWYPG